MQFETTKHLNHNGKLIAVEELSIAIRKEVDFYDHLRLQISEMEKTMKTYVLAYSAHSAKLKKLIEDELNIPDTGPDAE